MRASRCTKYTHPLFTGAHITRGLSIRADTHDYVACDATGNASKHRRCFSMSPPSALAGCLSIHSDAFAFSEIVMAAVTVHGWLLQVVSGWPHAQPPQLATPKTLSVISLG